MKVIIPAKASSTRVPEKNWREFHGGRSLVDINIEAMMGCVIDPKNIYVSCECEERLWRIKRVWGITPILRDASLCSNDVPLTTWMRSICAQVPGEDDIVWSQVCDPLFDEHQKVITKWGKVKAEGYDSFCVVHPMRGYLLDEHLRPIGWQFGEWHTPSQQLPQMYTFPFTMSILTREAIAKTGYHVGARPAWHVSQGGSIDIDTEEDWELAQWRYERKHFS